MIPIGNKANKFYLQAVKRRQQLSFMQKDSGPTKYDSFDWMGWIRERVKKLTKKKDDSTPE